MSNAFAYDVAFSFTQQDEALALRLADLLEGRRSFVYSCQQEAIAGRDGEVVFAEVFAQQARIVVVLMRDQWGQTAFTRIEETAIRGRAFEAGYDFCLMVPLEGATPPVWFPRNRIWIGIERFGESAAATVIEARCQEAGGEPAVPTLAERAAREHRALEFSAWRQQYMRGEGVAAALAEFERVRDAIVAGAGVIRNKDLWIECLPGARQVAIHGERGGMLVEWRLKFGNSLEGAELKVEGYSGLPPFPGRWPQTPPEVVLRIHPDVAVARHLQWLLPNGTALDSVALAEHLLRWWLDGKHISKQSLVVGIRIPGL